MTIICGDVSSKTFVKENTHTQRNCLAQYEKFLDEDLDIL